MVTVDEIDRQLTSWERDVTVATNNIEALEQELVYQAIWGDAPAVTLLGDTKLRAEQPVADLRAVRVYLNLVRDTVRRARELRNQKKSPGQPILGEIDLLLNGQSIQLPAVAVPLRKRGLLCGSTVVDTSSAKELLSSIESAYVKARDVVFEIETIWKKLNPRMVELKSEAERLTKLAVELGQPHTTELTAFVERYGELASQVFADPFSVGDHVDGSIEPLVEAARERLDSLKEQKDTLTSEIGSAPSLLVTLKTSHQAARLAFAEREQKTEVENASALPRPLDDTVISQLEQWLTRLQETFEQGKWQAVQVGYSNWKAQLYERLAACEHVRAENLQPLNERRELRGLLDAMKAKAADVGLAEDSDLARIYKEAHTLLFSRPTPMVQARRLVHEYIARTK